MFSLLWVESEVDVPGRKATEMRLYKRNVVCPKHKVTIDHFRTSYFTTQTLEISVF